MNTRYLALATLLFSTCLSATAQDVVVDNLEETYIECEGDLRDLVRSQGKPSGPSKVRLLTDAETEGTVIKYEDRITNLPDYLHNFINDYKIAAQTVLDGGVSWLSDPTDLTLGTEYSGNAYIYPLHREVSTVDFTFPSGSSKEVIQQAARDAAQQYVNLAFDSLQSFLPFAFLSVNFDYPEAFWIGNAFRYGIGQSLSISYSPSAGEGTATVTLVFRFILRTTGFDFRSNGYLDYDYRSPVNITKGVQLYKSSIQTILDECQSDSKLKRLRKMYDWITHHSCYNRYLQMGYSKDYTGDTPWSPISALQGNIGQQAPVCEGYARALKVLCDKIGIPNILMAGDALDTPTGQPLAHMWNYVQLEDSCWYAIDATWDDPYVAGLSKAVSGYESQRWFLLGSTSEVAPEWTFLDSHPEQWASSYRNEGNISWELRSGPVLSQTAWVGPDPYDPTGDGNTDLDDIQLMAEKIAHGNDDIEDVDGNDRITIGDLVRLIDRYLSK